MSLQSWLALGQLASTLAAAATFVAYVIQLKVMARQISEASRANVGQTTFSLIQALQDADVRQARHVVGQIELSRKDYNDWTNDEREAVRTTAASYDVAGMLVRAAMVDRQLILANWGASIRAAYAIATPMIAARRRHFGSATYWDDFEWLAKQDDSLMP